MPQPDACPVVPRKQFAPDQTVYHLETGERMTVVAQSGGYVLVDRAAGQWTYPSSKLRSEELLCPIERRTFNAQQT